MKNKIPIHESMIVGILLSIIGGFLDAYTYILHGGVFANAQTGNIVLLSINLSQKDFSKALYYLMPILAFFIGVIITEIMKNKASKSSWFAWQNGVLILETILLFVIGLFSFKVPNAVVNITISFVCSVQVSAFRLLAGNPYASTMCTGNLRSAAEHLFKGLHKKDDKALAASATYFIILLSFCIGAILGTGAASFIGGKSIFICCLLLLFIIYLSFRYGTKGMKNISL